jgi:hypothetical protein
MDRRNGDDMIGAPALIMLGSWVRRKALRAGRDNGAQKVEPRVIDKNQRRGSRDLFDSMTGGVGACRSAPSQAREAA